MDRVRVGPVKGLKVAFTAFILSLLLAIAGVSAFIYLSSQRSQDNCEAVNEVSVVLRDIMSNAETLALNSHHLSQEQKAQAENFYDTSIRKLQPRKC